MDRPRLDISARPPYVVGRCADIRRTRIPRGIGDSLSINFQRLLLVLLVVRPELIV